MAHLHGLRIDAEVRPDDVAARGRRARRPQALAVLRRGALAAARPSGLRLPLRHRLVREERALDRREAARRLRRGEAAVRGARAPVRVGGGSVRRLPDARPGALARRDARVRNGRKAASARARRAAPARDPRDVRLQGRQVAPAGQPRSAGRAGLLGATRLRPRRVGRPLERLRLVNFVRRFSRTERSLHWVNATGFLLLLATGLILYLPRLSVLVGHLYLAVIHPATRHSLRGMTRGTVREDWARRHYPRWAPPAD